jgi:hypothetical protein
VIAARIGRVEATVSNPPRLIRGPWQGSWAMTPNEPPSGDVTPLAVQQRDNAVCLRIEDAWLAGPRPRVEDYLPELPAEERPVLLRELLGIEVAYRQHQGETPAPAEYRTRFPELTQLSLAAGQVQTGQLDRGVAAADELARSPQVTAETLYDCACVYAQAAAATREAGTAERYAARAVTLLRDAVAKGFKDATHMKRDENLDSLRKRDDFQKLLTELEKR